MPKRRNYIYSTACSAVAFHPCPNKREGIRSTRACAGTVRSTRVRRMSPTSCLSAAISRSPRSGAGQVRDATPRAGGRPRHYPSQQQVRFVPPFVLLGAGCLSRQWVGRSYTSQARPQETQQAYCRSDRIYSASFTTRPLIAQRGLGCSGQAAVRLSCSSADDRAWAGPPSRKTPNAKLRIPSRAITNWLRTMSNSAKTRFHCPLNLPKVPVWNCSLGAE